MIKFTRLSAAILLIASSFLLFASVVSAAPNDTSIQFEITPHDACPNLPGIQTEVPPGMVVDSNGNCYTPTPPPENVDLCLNLPGIQVVVPPGYCRTPAGNCYPQTTPPTTVCPNLPGIHTEVPDGYYLDPDSNTCLPVTVPPRPPVPEDVCYNLPGIQITTPEGMVNDNGYCYTPATPGPEPQPPLRNVPDFLQPFGHFLVDLVPEPLVNFLRELPNDIVNRLPALVFILVLIFILIPIPQSIREYLYKRRLAAFYKREQSIAEEKDNFITLASHYIRTPIAIMKDSVSLMSNTGDISRFSADTMNKALQTLGNQVSTSLSAAEANPALGNLANPSAIKVEPFWRSGFFWLPIALSIFFTILLNFLIGVVGDRDIGVTNAALQVFIVIIAIVILYLIVRNYAIQKKLREEKNALILHEQAIDSVRNNFLEQQTANISTALGILYFPSPSSPPSQPYNLYADGLTRLGSINDQFILLSQIKTSVGRTASAFDLKSSVDRAIATHQPGITAKNLVVENSVGNITIVQNEPLFFFVIGSILDNAIKFTEPGGHISISSHPGSKTIQVKVSDNGRGIDAAKLDQLFKPFSRAESAVDFSYEGLGLSLFLDRLILNYTGGSISVAPRTTGGTDVTITTPTDISGQTAMPSSSRIAVPK